MSNSEERNEDVASVNIQWKGTTACLDFRCECGLFAHFDTDFDIAIQCNGCGRVWELTNYLKLEPSTRDFDDLANG